MLSQCVEPVVKKGQVQDVLTRDPAVQKPLDDLEQIRRFAPPAHPDTDGGLAADSLDAQTPGHSGLQWVFLEIQNNGFNCLYHKDTSGNKYYRMIYNPAKNMT